MSIAFTSEPGSSDPANWEMTPQWQARWATLSARLIEEADKRGGSGHVEGLTLLLTPPNDGRGKPVKVIILEPHSALVVIENVSLPATWYLDDTPEDPGTVENMVTKILDNDTWLSVRLNIAESAAAIGGAGVRLSAWSTTR